MGDKLKQRGQNGQVLVDRAPAAAIDGYPSVLKILVELDIPLSWPSSLMNDFQGAKQDG